MAVVDAEDTVTATWKGLEQRLQRLTFYLSGTTSNGNTPDANPTLQRAASHGANASAHARLAALEQSFSKLIAQSQSMRDLLIIRKSLCNPNIRYVQAETVP